MVYTLYSVKIHNKTKHTILAMDAYEANSLLDKSFGLIDRSKPRSLILHTRFGIHTFGMKEPTDIIILDTENHVTSLKHSLKQNSIFLWNIRYDTVIELPADTLRKTKTEMGDRIEIEH